MKKLKIKPLLIHKMKAIKQRRLLLRKVLQSHMLKSLKNLRRKVGKRERKRKLIQRKRKKAKILEMWTV